MANLQKIKRTNTIITWLYVPMFLIAAMIMLYGYDKELVGYDYGLSHFFTFWTHLILNTITTIFLLVMLILADNRRPIKDVHTITNLCILTFSIFSPIIAKYVALPDHPIF